jgi:LacI family transcriptional regulator
MSDRRRGTPTMQDVARKAGVSQATVSLVLNGVAGVRVSELTRSRVIESAAELGYRRTARIRADERAGSAIGLIIDEIAASPFAVPLLEGAREAAWTHRCIVNVVSTRNDAELESATIHSMLAQPVIGLVYATLITRQIVPPSLPSDVPLVLLNCYDEAGVLASTVPDDLGGARAVTNALLAAGHKRIGHLAGEPWLDAGRDRLEGFRSALGERNIPFDPALVQNLGSSVSAGYDGTQNLLDLSDPPTAIFCFNDRMALGALEAARSRGLRTPEDLSIAGFDNDPFAEALFPGGLTTAVLPHEAMARWAVDHLIDIRHQRRAAKVQRHIAGCPIVRRRSIARPTQRPSLQLS